MCVCVWFFFSFYYWVYKKRYFYCCTYLLKRTPLTRHTTATHSCDTVKVCGERYELGTHQFQWPQHVSISESSSLSHTHSTQFIEPASQLLILLCTCFILCFFHFIVLLLFFRRTYFSTHTHTQSLSLSLGPLVNTYYFNIDITIYAYSLLCGIDWFASIRCRSNWFIAQFNFIQLFSRFVVVDLFVIAVSLCCARVSTESKEEKKNTICQSS